MRTLAIVVLLAFAVQCHGAEESYSSNFQSLFDTNNVAYGTSTNRADFAAQTTRIKTGMEVAGLIAVMGKPRNICWAWPNKAGLWYSNAWIVCSNGMVGSIGFRGHRVEELAVRASRPVGAEEARHYWACYTNLFDPENKGVELTNASILGEDLKNGGVAGVRVGMTMSEVVARWGKPAKYYGNGIRSGSGIMFYPKVLAFFRQDKLEHISNVPHEGVIEPPSSSVPPQPLKSPRRTD